MKRSAIPENSDVSSSSTNKTFLIVVVTIGALLVLGLLLFFGKQFVGKAIATTTVTTLTQGSTASVPITVAMGASQARSYYFELTATGVSLCSDGNLASAVSITSGYGTSGLNPLARCLNGVLTFEDSFSPPMNNLAAPGPTGDVTLATIHFTVPTINQITFHFNTLEVMDETGAQVISGQNDIVLPVSGTGTQNNQPFSLTSTAFTSNLLSTRYTCGGASMSPPLTIQNIPDNTASFALIMDDLDATNTNNNQLTHWLMYNIPRGTGTEISTLEGSSLGTLGTNDNGAQDYYAPCPDVDATHDYRIRVYALDNSFLIPVATEGEPEPMINKEALLLAMGVSDAATSINGHVLGIATLSGAYTHTAVTGRCGDENIDLDLAEQCDGTNLGSATCISRGFAGGMLSCFQAGQSNQCTFDTSGCTTICGNGQRERTEQCDDGNTANGDGCSSMCTTEVECTEQGTCPAVGDLFRDLNQEGKIALCAQYGIEATTCPGTSTFNANINGDAVIDDRDALFIFQAIEAKQSAYNYCGAVTQPPCVFGDRAICEDVSYVWTADTSITNAPTLPTSATSTALNIAGIVCGSLEAGTS